MFIPLYTEIDEQQKKGKLKLVLDLDNTLIHCVVNPISPLTDYGSECTNNLNGGSRTTSPPSSPPTSRKRSSNNNNIINNSSLTAQIDEAANSYKNVHVMCLKGVVYYVKFRAGTSEFLRSMSRLYDIYLYTLAHRSYAKKVVAMLGPAARYIKDVIARNDIPGRPSSKLLKYIPFFSEEDKINNYSNVIILDDDKDCVWQGPDTANLVRIHPFFYFKESLSSSTASSMMGGSSLGSSSTKKGLGLFEAYNISKSMGSSSSTSSSIGPAAKLDKCLFNAIIELMEIHNTYFSVWDVKASISLARAPILQKLCLLILNPSNQKYPKFQQNAKALGESMGATVLLEIPSNTMDPIAAAISAGGLSPKAQQAQPQPSSAITHVITSPWAKEEAARQAINAGITASLVSFHWLVECHKQWTRLDERPFILSASVKTEHIICDLTTDGLF
eukprot:TRINITY_DN15808_c0_g1_i1.p1 TRINITY_DN15808_c0_g1~~TRINITY_DN15808_c0_g1_i1.p1  ORF type:complete len:445 (-),score=100.87 TRINITY_DN15808_c0_g1_i1:131-1465(-)